MVDLAVAGGSQNHNQVIGILFGAGCGCGDSIVDMRGVSTFHYRRVGYEAKCGGDGEEGVVKDQVK